MSALQLASEILRQNSTIAGIVGDRVFPLKAPQSAALPHLVLDLLHEGDFKTLGGSGKWFDTKFSVASIAKTAAGANDLAEAVKDALDWSGPVSSDGSPSARIGEAQVFKDGPDVFTWSDDVEKHQRVTDYSIIWRS